METPLSYQPFLDQLIAFASTEERKPDLMAAKGEYFQATGEVFQDDKSFESRMASFFEYYLFDRKTGLSAKTPAQELFEQRATAKPEESSAYRSFTETTHGLFEVRKIAERIVRLRELFSAKDYDVTERRPMAGLEKGDILEARLIPFQGHLLFSGTFCCHPRAAVKIIRKEVKRRKMRAEASAREFAWECAKMALKVDRYRQIAIEKIYDFEHQVL